MQHVRGVLVSLAVFTSLYASSAEARTKRAKPKATAVPAADAAAKETVPADAAPKETVPAQDAAPKGTAVPAGGAAPPAGAAVPAAVVEPAAPPAETPPPAPAQAPAATVKRAPAKTFAPLKQSRLSHDMQFGLAVLSGTGYRGIFPYDEMVYCGQLGKRVCTGRLPVFLDVQPSFGFAKHWDVLVDLRFGLGQDFTHTHEFAVAPGFRYWVDPEESAKFFATIQVAYDMTSQGNDMLRRSDWAARNSNGFMFEVMHNFGAYVQFGETIGFARWLRFEIDAGLGVQARLP
jgi:hypothetical protein